MRHSLLMFLAPATASPQATTNSPPAEVAPAPRRLAAGTLSWKTVLGVLGNAAGLVALLAGCWLMLQVLGAFLPL